MTEISESLNINSLEQANEIFSNLKKYYEKMDPTANYYLRRTTLQQDTRLC